MIAAFAIGAFSPGLGVLFIAGFLPADLMAAAAHCGSCGSSGPPELVAPQGMEMWQGPIAARLISYGLLWILVVEIPLRVRRWATGWAGRGGREPSVLVGAGAVMAGTAVLAFFWVRALPALISPVFSWTILRESVEATNATWTLWPIFVIATTAIAGVAAVWPRPFRVQLDHAALTLVASRNVTSVRRTVVRQTVAVLVLTALLAGLATDVREAAVLIAGLLAAGPVATLVLPRLRAPRWLPPARSLVRWIMAMVIALAVGQLILTLTLDRLESPYLALVLGLAVAAPLFRLILDAGAAPSAAALASQGIRPGPPPAVITSTIIVLAVLVWLALPALASAHNWWSDAGELKQALKANWDLNWAMTGAALTTIASWLYGGLMWQQPTPPDEWFSFAPADPPQIRDIKREKWREFQRQQQEREEAFKRQMDEMYGRGR